MDSQHKGKTIETGGQSTDRLTTEMGKQESSIITIKLKKFAIKNYNKNSILGLVFQVL